MRRAGEAGSVRGFGQRLAWRDGALFALLWMGAELLRGTLFTGFPWGAGGYAHVDGPLAALSPERQNLADYFKETVAVVTNPAIDREREIEHFSTRAIFGRRPLNFVQRSAAWRRTTGSLS